MVEHLGQLDFLHGKENVVLLGPPGTGKTQALRRGDAREQGKTAKEIKRCLKRYVTRGMFRLLEAEATMR